VFGPINAFSFACSYGMRYIAKVLKKSLHAKFPDASEDELMKVEACVHIHLDVYMYICFFNFQHSLDSAHTALSEGRITVSVWR